VDDNKNRHAKAYTIYNTLSLVERVGPFQSSYFIPVTSIQSLQSNYCNSITATQSVNFDALSHRSSPCLFLPAPASPCQPRPAPASSGQPCPSCQLLPIHASPCQPLPALPVPARPCQPLIFAAYRACQLRQINIHSYMRGWVGGRGVSH